MVFGLAMVLLPWQRSGAEHSARAAPVKTPAKSGPRGRAMTERGVSGEPLPGTVAPNAARHGSAGPATTPFFSADRSEEHTSELQSLMRISYAVFCLKKKNNTKPYNINHIRQ